MISFKSQIKNLDKLDEANYIKNIDSLLTKSTNIDEEYANLSSIINLIESRISTRNNYISEYKDKTNKDLVLPPIKYFDKYEFFKDKLNFISKHKNTFESIKSLDNDYEKKDTLYNDTKVKNINNFLELDKILVDKFFSIYRFYDNKDTIDDDGIYFNELKKLLSKNENSYEACVVRREDIKKILAERNKKVDYLFDDEDVLYEFKLLLDEQEKIINNNNYNLELENINIKQSTISHSINDNDLYYDYSLLKNNKRVKPLFYKIVLYTWFIISLSVFGYSLYKICLWKSDSNNTHKEIDDVSTKTVVEETKDNENVEIVPVEEEIEPSNPYWDYIKMNLVNVDFKELKNSNSDIVSWIKVEGTNINYPVLQTDNNTYYLNHSFNRGYNDAGWVFMDYRNDLDDKNTIIYAHNRLDNTMFGTLSYTLKKKWLNDTSSHVIRMSTENENTLWQIFSVYNIRKTSDYLDINFNNNSEFLNFSKLITDRSIYNFNTPISENDKILTLSTCYGYDDERTVVHAKLIKREVRS